MASGLDRLRRLSTQFVVFGLAMMALGALCVVKANTATTFSILALGWVLAISGVLWLASSIFALNWHGFFLYALNAVVRCVTGYLLIRHPDAGAAGVTLLIAGLLMIGGIFRGVAASVLQFPRWGWTLFSGVVSVALGAYLLSTWPAATAFFVGLMIGIDLIFDGASLAGFGVALRTLPVMRETPRAKAA
jgi:uncharacterized membrane protein HdeD (DUF308 family)